MDFSLLATKKSHSTTHTCNIDLNDTLNLNRDDEHLVEGQVQGGVEDDDVFAISILEEENVLIDVLHEGDKTNEYFFNFHFNVSGLYYMNLSFIKYCQSN